MYTCACVCPRGIYINGVFEGCRQTFEGYKLTFVYAHMHNIHIYNVKMILANVSPY